MATSKSKSSKRKEAVSGLTSQLAELYDWLHHLEAKEEKRDERIRQLEIKNKDLERKLGGAGDTAARLDWLQTAIKSVESKQNMLLEAVDKVQRSWKEEADSLRQEFHRAWAHLNQRIDQMQWMCNQAERLAALQDVMNQLENRDNDKHDLTHKIDLLKRKMQSLEDKNGAKSNGSIAFSAGKRFVTPLGLDLRGPDKWNKIDEWDLILVPSPCFNKDKVLFTAPIKGTYAFYAELWQVGSGQLLAGLEGARGVKYHFGKTSGDGSQCCGLAVLKLNASEHVWVAVKRLGGAAKIQEYWFSGWLLG